MTAQRTFELLFSEEERLKTFETWPNETTGTCTPEKLAQAGFYFLPCVEAPDNVCCIFCKKELDGWEPDDDPFTEHKKHSEDCPYMALPQPFSMMNLTIKECFELCKKVTVYAIEKEVARKEKEYLENTVTVKEALRKNILG